MGETKEEDEYINSILAELQPQYPTLTVAEMRELFDQTYDRCVKEDDDAILSAELVDPLEAETK